MTAELIDKSILVTGGAGFIGSHLVEDLVADQCRVKVFDNFSSGKMENLRDLGPKKFNAGKDFELIEGDIRDLDQLMTAVKDVDYVFHQAALGSVPRSVADPITTDATNAGGSLNVFWASRQNKVKRVVFASSSSIYGDSEILPKKEGQEGAPLSPYALSKKINEQYSALFKTLYDVETVGLRYFNVYGPRQDPFSQYAAVIPRFCEALIKGRPPTIYGTGLQSRDFTYVKDVVQANIKAMLAPASATGLSYNVGRGSSSTLLELLDVLKQLLKSDIEPVFDPPGAGDVMHSTADTNKAFEVLGFRAGCDLKTGLEKSIDWFKNYFADK